MTLFTWLNKQGVRSDAGFELQRTGRFTAEYREHGGVTELSVEGGGRVLVVHEDSFRHLYEGIQDKVRREAERERIIKNLREAVEFQGMEFALN